MDNLREKFVVAKDGKYLAQGDFVVTFMGDGGYCWDCEWTTDPELIHDFWSKREAESFAWLMDGTAMLWEEA